MATDDLKSLIPLAVRLYLDSISYSDALPGWVDPLAPDYPAIEAAVARRLDRYLAGDRPTRPFEIAVPRKDGEFRTWLLPSVSDQILLGACAVSLAGPLAAAGMPESSRVFSYRLADDPDRLALSRGQIRSWTDFQIETRRRLANASHLLQIDLERAFLSIDRGRFLRFLRERAPEGRPVDLLAAFLDPAVVPAPGLPMINDALSFLGNAYFHEVDEVFRRHGADFIRFVDDYRVFGSSGTELERILGGVSGDLRSLGFRINARKLRLGRGEEYLEAVSKLEPARTTTDADGYVSAAIFEDLIGPEPLAGLIERALNRPEEILTEGYGRFLSGALRRLRINEELVALRSGFSSPRDELKERLDRDPIVTQSLARLHEFAFEPALTWRALSILDLMGELPTERLQGPLIEMLKFDKLPEIVRLRIDWRLAGPERQRPPEVEVFEADYLAAGRLCYGEEAR